MNPAIGVLELSSLARGMLVADSCLKAAAITLKIRTTCPGKTLLIFSGEISAVQSALQHGAETAGTIVIGSLLLGNIHPAVLPALAGIVEIAEENRSALGIIETFSVTTAIRAADTAAKAAQVKILDIRPAHGLGGKGLVLITGSIGAVQAALDQAADLLKEESDLVEVIAIPAPHAELWEQLV